MSRNTSELAADLLHAALRVLVKAGGSLPSREVIQQAKEVANPTGDECSIYPSSGSPKWKAVMQFQSVGLVKAGWVQKRKGVWHITTEGEAAAAMSPSEMWAKMNELYKEWKAQQPAKEPDDEVTPVGTETTTEGGNGSHQGISTEEVESLATQGIEKAIRALTPYEFQDLVAALFRGMGYYTPFVAPKGKDGGVDVIAYKDPLGTEAPAILCQVKHRPDAAAGIADVQRLMGALQVGKNVGLFVTSGRFSSDAVHAARTSHVHIELVDMSRFIELWIEHYDSLDEDDRALLRLRTIHVLSE
jgi:restriction system protein